MRWRWYCILGLALQCRAQLQADTSGVYPLNQEAVTMTASSVQVQVCIGGLLSDARAAFQVAVQQELSRKLSSTAFFLTRVYSSTAGDICFFYVFQATGTEAAQRAFLTLSPQAIQLAAYPSHLLESGRVTCV